MTRTRRGRPAGAAVLLLVTALSGCGGGAQPAVAEPSSAAEASSSDAPVAGAEGTWERVATTADAEALGLDPALASEMLGPDGEMPVDLEIARDEWKIYVTDDAGERELGDFGTWSSDGDGRWMFVSESPGCRGCEAGLLVAVEGDRLTTELDDGNAPAADVHLVTEGSWTRQS